MKDENGRGGSRKKGYSASVTSGAVALVFLIIGFQTALFVHKAAVTAIVDKRDHPDTVFVVDRALAEQVLGDGACMEHGENALHSNGQDISRKHKLSSETGPVSVRHPAEHSAAAKSVYKEHAVRRVESFRFDPNTVSQDDLERLGFSEKQAMSIVNYRNKGGRFRRKTDFAKSYVVADSVYQRLEPYIDIPLTDLNLADSATFDALPGIGGYFASKMVEYRQKLGGSYSYKEQLMDIWKFDAQKYDALSDLVTVDSAHVRAYPLWTLPEDSLRLHPYIGSYAAHGIVVFRDNTPSSQWSVQALAAAGVLRPEMAEKLARCRIASR